MRVGIDIQSTVGFRTGIGYYASALTERLKDFKGLDLYCYKNNSDKDFNTIKRIYWENISLLRLFGKDGIDILHVPGFAGPIFAKGIKKITTVHDLIGMIYPQNLAPISRFYWQVWLPACVRNSNMIIADSENTKKDIIRLLNIRQDRIRVIYLAANRSFSVIAYKGRQRDRLKKYGINTRYILNVGTIEPRKNVANLIRAFAGYLNNSRMWELSLVIVGKKGWAYNEALKTAIDMGVRENIIFCDYIDEADLVLMYNLAELFIYPSFYEGFGLPVLEAMGCAAPVICSNTSSLPELAGDAAILVDPSDNAAIEKSIADILSDDGLKKTLSDRSLKQAARFSWEKAAKETMELYREVMDKNT